MLVEDIGQSGPIHVAPSDTVIVEFEDLILPLVISNVPAVILVAPV